MGKLDVYEAVARQLRADSIRCSTAAGSGHPMSSLSSADLMAVLLVGHLWPCATCPARQSPRNSSMPAGISARHMVNALREARR
jgi:transketolase N-terminal domain/subunit